MAGATARPLPRPPGRAGYLSHGWNVLELAELKYPFQICNSTLITIPGRLGTCKLGACNLGARQAGFHMHEYSSRCVTGRRSKE